MKTKKIIWGLAGPALLMASLFSSCGGGGGSASSSSSFTPSNITTQEEAKDSSQSLSLIKDIVSFGKDNVNTASLQESQGLLKAVLKSIEDKNFDSINTQSVESCDISGSMQIEQVSENYGYIVFNNCKQNSCETLNGRVEVYFQDSDNNEIPEKVSLTFKKGFNYQDTCENGELRVNGDFSISLNGKLSNGDIYTSGGKLKAELALDGGDLYANDSGRQSLAHFYNLKFYGNEVDPADADIEYAINGGISYKPPCLDETINILFNTIRNFKEFNNAGCPYEGKLSINDGQVYIEAYNPDNNPYANNEIRVTFGDEVVFDNDCNQLESLGVCP